MHFQLILPAFAAVVLGADAYGNPVFRRAHNQGSIYAREISDAEESFHVRDTDSLHELVSREAFPGRQAVSHDASSPSTRVPKKTSQAPDGPSKDSKRRISPAQYASMRPSSKRPTTPKNPTLDHGKLQQSLQAIQGKFPNLPSKLSPDADNVDMYGQKIRRPPTSMLMNIAKNSGHKVALYHPGTSRVSGFTDGTNIFPDTRPASQRGRSARGASAQSPTAAGGDDDAAGGGAPAAA